MESERIAKTVIISSIISVFIICSALYLTRGVIIDYVGKKVVVNPEQGNNSLVSHSQKVISAIEKVNPAVVSVVVTKDVPKYERYYDTFGGFKIPRLRESGTEEKEVGGGSGFIVSNDGLIVTNRHVVEDVKARYSVLLNDGTDYQVEVLARDPQLDIAILKISEPLDEALTFVSFGDSDTLNLGETVIAIGNALAEFRNSVSVGVVSGLARSVVASDGFGRTEQLDQVIQTDAAINPGNSGGPLLNINGKVIGVNVATSRGADNIGFALPGNIVKSVVDAIKQHGEIVRPFLGVRYTMITEKMAEQNNLEVSYGALVIRGETEEDLAVMPGSPAERAKITENNIILSIDGEELRERDLVTILRSKTVGQEIMLKVLQNGEVNVVTLILDKAS